MKKDLSICIANYNTKQLLQKCLRSIFKNTSGLNFEVLVVDNGSVDNSVEMVKTTFPKVKITISKKNLYFSKAYNLALTKSTGTYCLILNSDTQIPKNSLRDTFVFMQKHPKVGAASCREINENGQVDKTCSRFPTPQIEFLESNMLTKPFRQNKILKRYRYDSWKRNTTKEVDVIPGSFMLIRKSVLEKIGYFDENLSLYYGDNDLCVRIKQTGQKIYHLGTISIIHLQSQSVKLLPQSQIFKIALQDMLYYYRKHFGFFWWLFLWITFRSNWLFYKLISKSDKI